MSSAEVLKKRGRPKKVVADAVEVDITNPKQPSTTRAKSTKSAPKTTRAKQAVPEKKPILSSKPAPTISSQSASSKPAIKSPASQGATSPSSSKGAGTTSTKPPVTPASSRILQQIRGLSKDNAVQPEQAPNPSSTTASSKPGASPAPPKPVPSQTLKAGSSFADPISSSMKNASSSSTTPKAPSVSPNAQKATPHAPIAAMNSTIVSQISERGGARPNAAGSQQLPKNYKPVARKVTLAIVALPIAIVTSWVLYQRFVLGEERKYLVNPKPPMVDQPVEVEVTSEPVTEK